MTPLFSAKRSRVRDPPDSPDIFSTRGAQEMQKRRTKLAEKVHLFFVSGNMGKDSFSLALHPALKRWAKFFFRGACTAK